MCGPGIPEVYLTCEKCGEEEAYDYNNDNVVMRIPEFIIKEDMPGDGGHDAWIYLISGYSMYVSPYGNTKRPLHAFYEGPNPSYIPFGERVGYFNICAFKCYSCGHNILTESE